jgi:hypothetical protein
VTFGSVDSTLVTGTLTKATPVTHWRAEPQSVAANESPPTVDSLSCGSTRFGEGYDFHHVWRKQQYITTKNIIGSWVSFNLSWISLSLIFIASKQLHTLIRVFAFSTSTKKTTESEIQKTIITQT